MPRAFLIISLLLLSACNGPRGFLSGGGSPREQYAASLQSAGLSSSAMARAWTNAASKALRQPLAISLPYKEAGFFPPDVPRATGLRFTAPRGQKVRIGLNIRPDTGAGVFAELWKVASSNAAPSLVKSLEPSADSFSYEVDGEGETFVLRLQPELLVAVSYTLTITGAPSLGFPVKGGGQKDIGSLWGDPRDAGARRHEGIDIFGKKRTPVVAAAAGTITRVQETAIGGKVVWLRPEGRPLSFYYAHLDEQSVTPGQRVKAGETLGLLGNTGNARSTSPHLHFGIYAEGGAVNPYYFVAGGGTTPPSILGKTALLDSMTRTEGRAQLVEDMRNKDGVLLPSGTACTILAAAADHYRVALPDGREGWLKVGSIRPLSSALRTQQISAAVSVHFAPISREAVKTQIPAGSAVRILATGPDRWVYGSAGAIAGWWREE